VPEPDLVELFARPLHRAGARHLVAGSVGAMLYSEPRLTIDIDLAVALEENDLAALPAIFAEPDFYCPPLAVLQSENRRTCRAHFNVLHIPTGLKADFYPSQHDPFFGWAWDHRQTAALPGGDIQRPGRIRDRLEDRLPRRRRRRQTCTRSFAHDRTLR